MNKKQIIGLITFSTLSLIFVYLYITLNKEDNGIYPSFFEENNEWADEELKKMNTDNKINQFLFVEIDSLFMGNFTPSAIAITANSFNDFIEIKEQFKTNNIENPIFVNLFTDGLYHFNEQKSDLNINHFFANTDTNSIKNLNQYVIDLNLNLAQNFHVFSFLNLLPETKYDSTFYAELVEKTITTTELSQKNKLLNGFWCKLNLTDIEKDTLKYKNEISITKQLIEHKIPAIFLKYPSPTLVEFLRENLRFRALIISDYRDKTNFDKDEISELIEAGNSFFLLSENAINFREKLSEIIKNKDISTKYIDKQVKTILLAKKWAEKKDTLIEKTQLCQEKDYKLLSKNFIENSITLVKNSDKLIPLKKINSKLIVYNLGSDLSVFNSMLKNYSRFTLKKENFSKNITKQKTNNLIISINSEKIETEQLEYIRKILQNIKSKNKAIIVNFGKVENLLLFDTLTTILQAYGNSELEQKLAAQAIMGGVSLRGVLPNFHKEKKVFPETLITTKNRLKFSIPEEVNMDSEKLKVIDSIALAEISSGTFPGCQIFVAHKGVVVYNKAFGFHTYSKNRKVKKSDLYDLASLTKTSATAIAAMKMFDLEKIGMNTTLGDCVKDTKIDYTRIEADTIIRIDTLLIREIPNLEKLVASSDTVNLNDSMIVSYDTIIAKLTPSRNIFKVKLSEMLVHQSGIMPVLPMLPYYLYKIPHKRKNFRIKTKKYKKVKDSLRTEPQYDTIYIQEKKLKRKEAFAKYFSKTKKDSSQMQIAKNMYFHDTYRDTLWIETKQLNVAKEKKYQYTDVNMILVQIAIDSLNEKTMDEFMSENFYKDLGLNNTCYLPLKEHSKETIVPTSYDKIWRNQLLQGYVHDPSAAIMGGISGNAGLFSNAQELGVLYQMLLNKGTYGGKRYLSSEIIEKFTQRQKDCVRGLGFEIQSSKAIMSKYASKKTYGHTGFTGICAWVDPETELVFIFVSNRVHPSSRNGKINSHRVRQKIHDAIYLSIEK